LPTLDEVIILWDIRQLLNEKEQQKLREISGKTSIKGLRDSAGSCSFFASSPERDAAGKKRVIASSLRHSIIAKARPVAISFFYNARKEGGQQSRLNGLRISDGREIKIPFTGTAAE